MWVVGIDENGFGPILGPLVVTATVFELQRPYTPNYFWGKLSGVISKSSKDFPQKLTVYNSKEVFRPRLSRSYETLETTVLTFFNLLFKNFPAEFKDFFSQVSLNSYTNPERSRRACPEDAAIGEVCQDVNFSLPIWANNEGVPNQKRLEEELAKAEIKILGVKSVLVCPGQFNGGLNQFGSKFYLNFLQFTELIKWVLAARSQRPPRLPSPCSGMAGRDASLTFLCGKIGSQKNYRGLLKKGYFKDFEVKPEVQTGEVSTYNFSSASSNFNLSFIKGGDKYHFPIALSSLFGKYIREVFMRHQNLVFQKQDPSLKPVSGYRDPVTKTFIRNTKNLRQKMGLPDKCFLRQK